MGVPKEEPLIFNFCPRKGLFSATGVRRIPSREMALGVENGSARITLGTVLAMRARITRDVMGVHRMIVHSSEDEKEA